jgi:hypothetical protein
VSAWSRPRPWPDASGRRSSRSTAYRYFPGKRALLVAAHPETAATTMLPADPPQDPAARLDAVVANFTAMILDTEAQQRTMLRLSLEAGAAERDALPLRQGRAIAWIAEALDGVRADLTDQQFRQLVVSIRATIGIEAIAWLVDVAGLPRNDAVALTRWSAQALLQHATTTPPPAPSQSGRPGRPPTARTPRTGGTGPPAPPLASRRATRSDSAARRCRQPAAPPRMLTLRNRRSIGFRPPVGLGPAAASRSRKLPPPAGSLRSQLCSWRVTPRAHGQRLVTVSADPIPATTWLNVLLAG